MAAHAHSIEHARPQGAAIGDDVQSVARRFGHEPSKWTADRFRMLVELGGIVDDPDGISSPAERIVAGREIWLQAMDEAIKDQEARLAAARGPERLAIAARLGSFVELRKSFEAFPARRKSN